tara:strand:- start:184 stop:402 length:219 start_codon:yes stop_codon:yes gene_type:complete
MRSVRAALGDYKCVTDDLTQMESRAAVRVTFKGIHRAPSFYVAETVAIWVLGDVDSVKQQSGSAEGHAFSTE